MKDSKVDLDNYSNQLNPNNDAYWQSRGYDEKPSSWDDEDDSSSDSSYNSNCDDGDSWDDDVYEPFGDSGDYD